MATTPMTLNEAAEDLGLDPSTLRRQIANGRLRATKVGPVWTVTPAELKRYREQSLGKAGRPYKRGRSKPGAAASPAATT